MSSPPNLQVFGLWGKPKHPEETHANTEGTCKLHIDMLSCSAGTQIEDLLAVRQQSYLLSRAGITSSSIGTFGKYEQNLFAVDLLLTFNWCEMIMSKILKIYTFKIYKIIEPPWPTGHSGFVNKMVWKRFNQSISKPIGERGGGRRGWRQNESLGGSYFLLFDLIEFFHQVFAPWYWMHVCPLLFSVPSSISYQIS